MTWDCENLFDESEDGNTYLPNEAGETYIRLIHEEWKTNKTVQIENGEEYYVFRGFMGDYDLKIMQGSKILNEFEFKLDDDLEIFCANEDSSIICDSTFFT